MKSSSSTRQSQLPPVAGVKRSAPAALLPAFEEDGQNHSFSSSPTLPRPSKRLARFSPSEQHAATDQYLVTPAPTSSTGIIPSSPPQLPLSRPSMKRTQSTISERTPLSNVPQVILPRTGDPILMGRSGASSHYQLSANRYISRVHLRAAYTPTRSPSQPQKIEIVCLGHNGVVLHCRGRVIELCQGDSFASEKEHADIMIDVQDARVLISWPQDQSVEAASDHSSTAYNDDSPSRLIAARYSGMQSSPTRRIQRLPSPVSPVAASQAILPPSTDLSAEAAGHAPVQVYEDERGSDVSVKGTQPLQSTQQSPQELKASTLSEISAHSEPRDDFSDQDEENDPIIHSFGPFGENLLPRMASFSATDKSETGAHAQTLKEGPRSPRTESLRDPSQTGSTKPVANHVVNQLAYSRLSSTPLSTIISNLAFELKGENASYGGRDPVSIDYMQEILDDTPCIGKVSREGKDAAGKPLESEYYYVPDLDDNETRKNAVVEDLRKPGLRACRKQHKASILSTVYNAGLWANHTGRVAILLEKAKEGLKLSLHSATV